jgi:ppGpp synthetase/RelA/SpoT-type nucleotidyltranferase
MNTTGTEEARAKWISERPKYVEFSELIKARLGGAVKSLGVYADVSARAKEVHSLVKKLLIKSHHTYESLPDKVGARIVVRYLAELPVVLRELEKRFAFIAADDKAKKLARDRVGYLTIHVDGLCLQQADPAAVEFPPQQFFVELQLRTLAQHLWAEISHDAFYKNDELVESLSEDLQRRVFLMAGLIEVADREINRMNSELPDRPGAHLFKNLETLYYRLSARKPNVELSLEVINLLLPLYHGESEKDIMNSHVAPVFATSEELLRHVYSNPNGDFDEASAFLFQPEALLLYDRLKSDPDGTLAVWNQKFPTKELERVATAFGLSLD